MKHCFIFKYAREISHAGMSVLDIGMEILIFALQEMERARHFRNNAL